MGQYYKPVNLTTFEWLYSHDYKNGLKLMEHSWIGNNFVGRIMKLLTKGNKWYKTRIVWCGDYSEKIIGETDIYDMCFDEKNKDDEVDIKVFKKIKPRFLLKEKEQNIAILVNHTKKEYVKLSECKKDKWGIINPLPLLTALGNGGGGGDYHGKDLGLVGRWACDEISVEFDEQELKEGGFTELKTNFKEGEDEGKSEKNEEEAYTYLKNIWIEDIDVKKRIILGRLN